MNNADFRRMVSDDRTPTLRNNANTDGSNKATLGARMRLGVPMTPRNVKGAPSVNFAQQLAAQNAISRPTKKFRATAAPKGTKLAAGYHDRTQTRSDVDSDDKASRVKALEEQMKLGQIDAETFEQLRDQITGGDASATHLVKGLDRRLLERVRRGEDVFSAEADGDGEAERDGARPEQADDAQLEELENMEVKPVEKIYVAKRGEMAPPVPVAGVKRSRNDILAELKASRKAAEDAAQQSQLGSRFRKLGDKKPSSRIEVDAKGRQVLITVDEKGNVKRKVRKMSPSSLERASAGLLVPDRNIVPLGMAVPESVASRAAEADLDDEDDDIFEGVGADYDPLGEGQGSSGSDDSDSDSDSETEPTQAPTNEATSKPTESPPHAPADPQPQPQTEPLPRRNYFNNTISQTNPDATTQSLNDPSILAAIKHAANIAQAQQARRSSRSPSPSSAPSAAAQRILARSGHDRDLDDLDMGFGSSRFDDADEDGGDGGDGSSRQKLAEWRGLGAKDDEDEDGERGRGGNKARKRGKKKRRGDKESAADVLSIIEGRKKQKSKD